MWYSILDCIRDSVNHELEKKYRTIDMKLKKKLEQNVDKNYHFQDM